MRRALVNPSDTYEAPGTLKEKRLMQEAKPSMERQIEWYHLSKATGLDIFWTSWKGLKAVMEFLVKELKTREVGCPINRKAKGYRRGANAHLDLAMLVRIKCDNMPIEKN